MAADDYESWRADTLSGTPEQVLERVAAFEIARRAGDHRGTMGLAVRDPRARAGRTVRRARDRSLPTGLMEPRAAVLAVLTEEPLRCTGRRSRISRFGAAISILSSIPTCAGRCRRRSGRWRARVWSQKQTKGVYSLGRARGRRRRLSLPPAARRLPAGGGLPRTAGRLPRAAAALRRLGRLRRTGHLARTSRSRSPRARDQLRHVGRAQILREVAACDLDRHRFGGGFAAHVAHHDRSLGHDRILSVGMAGA